MAAEDVVVFLRAQIGEFTGKLHQAEAEIQGLSTKGKGHFSQLAAAGKAAVLGITGGAVALGVVAVREALAGEQAHARLLNAIKNTGGQMKTYQKAFDDSTVSMAKFGFNQDEVAVSVANLTRATRDPAKAIREMGLAADIAKGRNIDLASATAILVKVQTGHVGLLGRLGINTKDATGHTITQTEALRRLAAMYGGQAQASANTYAGKTQALQAQLHNLTEELGEKLIPVLVQVVSVIVQVVNWFERHRVAAIALAAVIGGVLVAATVAWAVALFTAGGALAFLISPITLVVVAVAALAVGIVLLWTHWNQIWNFIAAHKGYAIVLAVLFPIIPAVLAVVAVAKLLYANWDRIWKAMAPIVKGAMDVIRGIIQTVTALIHGDWGKAWDGIKLMFSGAWKAIEGIVRLEVSVIRAVLSAAWSVITGAAHAAWNGIVAFFSSLPGRLVAALGALAGLLVGWIFAAGRATLSGALSSFGALVSFFGSIPGRIRGALGNVGGLLFGIGQAIMDSLRSGIVSGFQAVANFVGGIASKIKSLKGPPAYDRKLLVENGELLMHGLRMGLASGMARVRSDLGSYTSEIGGVRVPGVSIAPGRAGGPSVINHFDIHVTTFDKAGVAERIVDVLHPYVIRNGGKLPWERARESRV